MSVFCLLYLAIVGSSFTFLLLYWLLPRMTVTNLQTISLITPPGAVALGWFLGGGNLFAPSLLRARLVPSGGWILFCKIKKTTPPGRPPQGTRNPFPPPQGFP